MEQKPASLMKSSLMTGIYLGVVLILVSVVLYVAGLSFANWAQYVSYPILIAGAIWAQVNFKKELGGEMTYGQALGVGLMAIIFASVLSGIYTYILFAIIDPSLQEQALLVAEQKLVEQGRLSQEQIDAALGMQAKFMKPPIMAVMAVVGGAFIGLIISLITAIFTKKNPTDEVPE
ncbi:MAG: DUF4199 domain-containing protein [Draconibacterium sp.]|nr:DUF4199 domain-containing protein [Draconibacterium sp.]